MSPKRLSQPFTRLIGAQSWCINSDSVVDSDGKKKVNAPEHLYKNVLNYVLYKKCSNRVGQKSFFHGAKL